MIFASVFVLLGYFVVNYGLSVDPPYLPIYTVFLGQNRGTKFTGWFTPNLQIADLRIMKAEILFEFCCFSKSQDVDKSA